MRSFIKIIYILFCFLSFIQSCKILKPDQYLLKSNIEIGEKYSQIITSEDLNHNLSILASDDFEGRETTYPGQKKAAKFLKNKFINWGISGPVNDTGYYQKFNVDIQNFSNVNLIINGVKAQFITDFYSYGNPQKVHNQNIETIDVGYGIINKIKNPYHKNNVTGKVVLIKEGIPNNKDYKLSAANWRKKLKTAEKQGAIGVIFLKENYSSTDLEIKKHLQFPRMKMHNNQKIKEHLPVFFVNEELLKRDTINFIDFSTDVNITKTAENVLGFIPGKSEEVLVISAHYDHIGFDQGEICNGADDDGSGSVALLSIAKAFQEAYLNGVQPQRGILFLLVSGEEKGLFGSKYYTDNPIFPLSNTIADLNIDMIGRQDTIQKDNNYIYLIGSDKISDQLHIINEQTNSKYIKFNLDYTYNDENDPNQFYYRSDHYNFAKNNIPVIFYFGGLHEDYHKPSDEVDKIDFEKLEKVTQYIFLTAWELAYRKNAIK